MASALKSNWKRNLLLFNGVALGVPGATAAYFVYNLRRDVEFREHFQDKYPDLLDAIHEYVPIYPAPETRTDIGDADPTMDSASADKTPVKAVVRLASGKTVAFEVSPDVTMAAVHEQALAGHAHDRVAAVDFVDVQEPVVTAAPSTPAASQPKLRPGEPVPQSTWPSQYTPRSARASMQTAALQIELDQLRLKQQALQLEKRQGFREIDAIDADLARVEDQKKVLKAQLPRKKWLRLF
ncbi:hypothetical protein SPRG_11873 [Saprolegnia parasitica CBS 223.65]|uniref:Uncharacterized protein n=1 Tax=Saprolegnia parasitica (strain CBS 223.65) TaxID=695850 RepID=A0A067C8Z1_SAPPC|nr:hypothetical protein SPRG_11873 [Saprolegnia parasitica CBS 223.65]KDO23026.1 hypothetical protein SPRG_11873 [Saprolegnia parasitica CBS 223.65]|eukprot:XP_012206314.1 hypothetical protein SPRG_11873 [Saprolegnia parasitica CBS 223.65]